VAYEDQSGDDWRYEASSSTGFMAVLDDIAAEQIDGQPDRYRFNFGGMSGELILTWQGKAKFVASPFKKISIEHYQDGNGRIIKWILTTPDGTKYTFDKVETTKVSTTGGSRSFDDYTYNSSWYLTKIESANSSNEVDLSYQAGGDMGTYFHSKVQQMAVYPQCQNGNPTGDYYAKTQTTLTDSDIKTQYHLKSIYSTASRDSIVFQSSNRGSSYTLPNEKKLDQVKFYRSGNLRKKYVFTYSTAISSRLTLSQLQLEGSASTDQKDWSFDYNTSYNLPSPAPGSSAIDHWGYFNGATGNSGLMPSYSIGYFSYSGADRSPDASKALAGTLTKITYPTGGYTDFDYEIDQYRDGSSNKIGGGIRLKKMVSHDGLGNTITKEYSYEKWNNSGVSSGVLYDQIDYTDYINLGGSSGCEDNYHMVYSNSRFPMRPTGGAPVGYSEVTEISKDSQGNILGYTRRTYTTPQSDSNYWWRGEPVDVFNYDKNKNLLKSKHFTYSTVSNYSQYPQVPYYTSFEDSGDFASHWETNSTGFGSVGISSSGGGYKFESKLVMQIQTSKFATANTNTAVLNLDLSHLNSAKLVFWWYDTNSNYSSQDGVYFSNNGGNSYSKIYSLANASSGWSKVVLNLENYKSLTSDCAIKFQQYEDQAFASDEFGFDEIKVFGNIDSNNAIYSSARRVRKEYFDASDPNFGMGSKVYYHSSLYYVESYWRTLQEIRTRVYDPTDPSLYEESTKEFNFDNYDLAQRTQKIETNSDGQVRKTDYMYANEKYTGMQEAHAHMLTQPYKVTVRDGSDNILKINWTLWKDVLTSDGSHYFWHPCEQWVGSPQLGTSDPADCN
jgi:hypothetical protein